MEIFIQDPNDEPAEKLLERIREDRKKWKLAKKRKGGRENEI